MQKQKLELKAKQHSKIVAGNMTDQRLISLSKKTHKINRKKLKRQTGK